jgi:hypothetical protein
MSVYLRRQANRITRLKGGTAVGSVGVSVYMLTVTWTNGDSGIRSKGKSKAIPVREWRDPEGSTRLGLPDFKTVGT